MFSILLPSRGRPQNMKRLVESARTTAIEDPEFVFYLDEDDLPSIEMARELKVKHIIGPRIVLSEMWNECYKVCSGDILMHCGDDIIFRTQGWDKIVEDVFNEYPDKIAFVYGRDGYSPDTFGTHGFLSRAWVETVGHFVPPYFSSDFNDTWLNEVSEMIGRHRFVPELYTEHMHPINGKAEWDQTHQERLARHEKDGVAGIYESKLSEREEDVKKLKEYINDLA
jgi:hypothetical protein